MLRHGLHSFLDAAAVDPAVQRIVLIDGPAVLGWETWRGLEEQFGLGVLRHALDLAVADGVIVEQPTEPLAHMLLAVVDEAALYIANVAEQAPRPDRDQPCTRPLPRRPSSRLTPQLAGRSGHI